MTRDGLRDGSLLAAAQLRAPPGTVFRSDAAIQADLDATLASHQPGRMFGCSAMGLRCGTRHRWITARTEDGAVRATTFVVNRDYPRYAGRLPENRVAERLANASGSLGSCAAYLEQTIGSLRQMGRRDRSLERLQALMPVTAEP